MKQEQESSNKYLRYRQMEPPSPPNTPIHVFFQGISQQAYVSGSRSNEYYSPAPVLAAEDSWIGSIIFEPSLSSSPADPSRSRPTISPDLIRGSRFILSHSLRKGYDRWAQTWIGCMLLPSGTMVPVVIKLFQESRFPIADYDPELESESLEGGLKEPNLFSRGARYASAEANAYTRLRHLQGNAYLLC